jgi:hypothetical protein
MPKDASSTPASERIRHEQKSALAASGEGDAPVLSPKEATSVIDE